MQGLFILIFERGFIRAETVSYDDLLQNGSMTAAREAGKVRLEGKRVYYEGRRCGTLPFLMYKNAFFNEMACSLLLA
ncbi:hypothetical protein GCM10020331_020020 [Ectobacillus funiculus]